VCVLLYTLGLAATSVVTGSLGLTIFLGVIVGLGQAASSYAVILSAVGRAVPESRRSAVLGLTSAAGSLGMFALVPASPALIAAQGWRMAFLALAAVSFLSVVAAFALRTPGADDDGEVEEAPSEAGSGLSLMGAIRPAIGSRSWWLLSVGFAVCGFQLAFIATYLPSALTDGSLSAATGAQVLATIGFANILGTYVFGIAGRIRSKSRLLAGIYLARGALLLAFILLPKTPLLVYSFGAAIGLPWSATVPLTAGLVSDFFGLKNVGLLFALVYVGHQFGSFIGAWAGGVVFAATESYNSMWTATALLSLVAAAIHWSIRRPDRSEPIAQMGAA
jgi:predicted MFS family arabinose efflux permease